MKHLLSENIKILRKDVKGYVIQLPPSGRRGVFTNSCTFNCTGRCSGTCYSACGDKCGSGAKWN
ncbi:hypothetical protein [Sedimentibacter sp.]|uniref:hypothetical protein n=1 Tax=Sedimentibacter sp. TaxID=1960295 RepID=UPI0028B26137|nr:hypothetical protein [Sedimentibacter sp.]